MNDRIAELEDHLEILADRLDKLERDTGRKIADLEKRLAKAERDVKRAMRS